MSMKTAEKKLFSFKEKNICVMHNVGGSSLYKGTLTLTHNTCSKSYQYLRNW